jgi:DNA repair exonuclease SbcCD ATPase subunit
LPCGLNVIVAMTAHSEKITRIEEELIRILQDKELKAAVELIADLIKNIRNTSNDLSGLHFEAQRFIPANTRYDENYWIAAYILYLNGHHFIRLCKEVEAIDEEIIVVDEYLQMLDKELEASERAVWALYKYTDKLSNFLDKISENNKILYKKLSSLKKEKDDVLYDSVRERCYFLDEIVHSIEDRINKANKEIEEADKDMGRMKEEYEAVRKHLEELEREKWRILDLIRDFVEEMESS